MWHRYKAGYEKYLHQPEPDAAEPHGTDEDGLGRPGLEAGTEDLAGGAPAPADRAGGDVGGDDAAREPGASREGTTGTSEAGGEEAR